MNSWMLIKTEKGLKEWLEPGIAGEAIWRR